jgi:hypothetical protein
LGLCALSSNNFYSLAAILRETKLRDGWKKINLINEVNPAAIFYHGILAELIKRLKPNTPTPASDYLFEMIRPLLKDYIPDDKEYDEVFDRFEYLFALNYIDLNKPDLANLNNNIWAPTGRFSRKYGFDGTPFEDSPLFDYIEEIKNSGPEFGLFKAGFLEDRLIDL